MSTNVTKLKTAMFATDAAIAAEAQKAAEKALTKKTPTLEEERAKRESLPTTLLEAKIAELHQDIEKLENQKGKIIDGSKALREKYRIEFEGDCESLQEIIKTHTKYLDAQTDLYKQKVAKLEDQEQQQIEAVDRMINGLAANLDMLSKRDVTPRKRK